MPKFRKKPVVIEAIQYDTVLCIWRIINQLKPIRSTIMLLFFLWVGELVLFKTNINNSINCKYFTISLVYYNICCIFVSDNWE